MTKAKKQQNTGYPIESEIYKKKQNICTFSFDTSRSDLKIMSNHLVHHFIHNLQ